MHACAHDARDRCGTQDKVQRLTVNKADHLVVLRAREVRTRSRTPFPPSCTSQTQTFVRASLLARSLAFCF